MSTAIQYDEAWTRRVEALYATSDMVAQRQAVLAGLAAQPGERIADLGAGPGMLAAGRADCLGQGGAIQGIDISQPMVDLARRRAIMLAFEPHCAHPRLARQLHALGTAGDYFFSINRYLFLVHKPIERYPA
jgi:trans-aconitate methyltransferase